MALVLGAEGAGPAPADAQDLRPAGAHPDGRRGRKPERVGGRRRLPVRGAAPAQPWTSLRRWRERARAGAARVCVLTGAGMSAESGIPTFRDAMTGPVVALRPGAAGQRRGLPRRPAAGLGLVRRAPRTACARPSRMPAIARWRVFADAPAGRADGRDAERRRPAPARRRAGRDPPARRHPADRWLEPCAQRPGCDPAARGAGPAAALRALRQPGAAGRWSGSASRCRRPPSAPPSRPPQRCQVMLVVGTSGVVWPAAGLAALAPHGRRQGADRQPAAERDRRTRRTACCAAPPPAVLPAAAGRLAATLNAPCPSSKSATRWCATRSACCASTTSRPRSSAS